MVGLPGSNGATAADLVMELRSASDTVPTPGQEMVAGRAQATPPRLDFVFMAVEVSWTLDFELYRLLEDTPWK